MNPLPVSLDLTNNSGNKSPSKASASNDAGDDKFKKELDKQERSSVAKGRSDAKADEPVTRSEEVSEAKKGATVAAEKSSDGEGLPGQVDIDESEYSQSGIADESVPHPTYLAGIPQSLELSSTEIAQPSLEGIEAVPKSTVGIDSVLSVNGDDSSLLSNQVGIIEGGPASPVSDLSASQNALGVINTGAAANVSTVIHNGAIPVDDMSTRQPLEKLMTLEQLKLSLEKGVEALAELEIDVDTDGEASVKEVFRFSDIQLKESQSSLKSYTTSVELPVSHGAWGDKVNDKIVWLANQKIQFAEIHLNPQELGPMEVKINVQNDQATVTFNSQHQGVRELLEMNVNRLRDMMNENGVELTHVDVSDQSTQQQSQEDSEGGVSGQGGEEGDDVHGLEGDSQITDAITLDNLIDYYA